MKLPPENLNAQSGHLWGLGSRGQGDIGFLLYMSLCTICPFKTMYMYCFDLVFFSLSEQILHPEAQRTRSTLPSRIKVSFKVSRNKR